MDGAYTGSGAGDDRDGQELASTPIGFPQPPQIPDIEILESWYPMLFEHRRVRVGAFGAGAARAGGGNDVAFRPYGTDLLVGQMLAMRAYVAPEGAAGGLPGATTELAIRRRDGRRAPVSTAAAGVVVHADEAFEIRCSSGGGVGDPLLRDPAKVAADVDQGLLSSAEASAIYGVVLRRGKVASPATIRRRESIRQARLRAAAPPAIPFTGAASSLHGGPSLPLYPGVRQRNGIAYAERSGTPLARSPEQWTTGCPVLQSAAGPGPGIVTRAYLDPSDGTMLMVEVTPQHAGAVMEVKPDHWA